MTNVKEITNDIEPLIREKVRNLLMQKLSMWNNKILFSDVIDEETENLMRAIRPALRRAGKKDG